MMKNQTKRRLWTAAVLLALFILWTATVATWDVQPIGPHNSAVGFATLNGAFHQFTGVHMTLYVITDWLGLVPLAIAMGFAVLGLFQWIKRKRLTLVDRDLFVLGGFYIAVMAVFLLFETVVINHRPVLIEGVLEASYPSSTTLLVTCVIPTAAMQGNTRIQNRCLRRCVVCALCVFAVGMVAARLLSGVHWLTDIVGGSLLSGGLVLLYRALCDKE